MAKLQENTELITFENVSTALTAEQNAVVVDDFSILPEQHWAIIGGNVGFIWGIKRYMGLMSTSRHQQHRLAVNVETVMLSGFFTASEFTSGLHQNIER